MEATQFVGDFWQLVLEQIGSVFASGTINIMIVIGICFFTQIVKMYVYWISKRILLFPIFLAACQTAFSYFVVHIEIELVPITFFGYLGGSVLFYFLFKKLKFTSKFFKSNYNFLEEKAKEKKSKK